MKLLYSRSLIFLYTIYVCNSYGGGSENAGYSKLLALSLTDDISTSTLNSDGLNYDKYSLPYEFKNLYIENDYSFSMQIKANYLKVKSSVANIEQVGSLRARWDIFSVSASPKIAYQINE